MLKWHWGDAELQFNVCELKGVCDVCETCGQNLGRLTAQSDMAKDGGVNSVQPFNMENIVHFCVK